MAPPLTPSGSNKRKHPGDDNSTSKRQGLFNDLALSDNESLEEDADMMDDQPYDEANEKFPQRPAFDKALYALDAKTVLLTKQLQKALEKHGLVSKDLQNMISKADEAIKPPTPERRMVAMVGATGAGKSSLLNAVTDTPQLAKELSAGESCTSVPTLYMHKLHWQTQELAAEIRYYTVDKCRKLLKELLGQYNLFSFELDEDWTSSQRNEYSQQADTAMQAFRTLFPSPDQYFHAGISKLTNAIADLPDQLGRLPGSVPLPMSAFQGILNAQISGITAAHYRRKTQYQEALANIKLDATLDQHTGHFAQAMQACYTQGKADSGKGICARIKTILYNHLIHQDPLTVATDLLADALADNARAHALALNKDVQKILCDITKQFQMILERGTETAKERQARRNISAFLTDAMPGIDRIERDLAKIRQKYSGL